MTVSSTQPTRPSWRQRLADRGVARALKVGGGQRYTQFTTSVPMNDGAQLQAAVAKTPVTSEGTHIYDALVNVANLAKDKPV